MVPVHDNVNVVSAVSGPTDTFTPEIGLGPDQGLVLGLEVAVQEARFDPDHERFVELPDVTDTGEAESESVGAVETAPRLSLNVQVSTSPEVIPPVPPAPTPRIFTR